MGWNDHPSTRELGWRAGLVFALVVAGIGTGFFLAHKPRPHAVKLTLDSGMEMTALVPPGGARLASALFAPAGDRTAGAITDRLLEDGVAVIEIPLADYHRHLEKEASDDCHYVLGDVEDMAHQLERVASFRIYRRPVMIGVGAGGAFAYGALAQAPANTVAGAVSLGFDPAVGTPRPFCPQTNSVANDHAGYDIAPGFAPAEKETPLTELVSPFTALSTHPDPELEAIAAGAKADPPRIVPGTGVEATVTAAIDIAEAAATADGDVPVEIIEPACHTDVMAVILSGDGGWRDLDKSIGERMAARGIGVVGVDSLAYFWSRKEPPMIGQDLAKVITRYQAIWKARQVLLIGYSFGADVLPTTWPHLPKAVQDAVRLIGLLGFSPQADYEISVGAYLGTAQGDDDTIAASTGLPLDRVICAMGKEEGEDSACNAAVFDRAERLVTDGGHHFDGDYNALADRLIAAFTKRSGDDVPLTCP